MRQRRAEKSSQWKLVRPYLSLLARSGANGWHSTITSTRKSGWFITRRLPGKRVLVMRKSVEEALCFGWIDGAIKGMDLETYAGRFTPRRKKSPWSTSNRERVARLLRDGRMIEAGLAVLPADLR